MTAKQLIQALSNVDPNREIYIGGYEGGVNIVSGFSFITDVERFDDNEAAWYLGEFDYEPCSKLDIANGVKYELQIY